MQDSARLPVICDIMSGDCNSFRPGTCGMCCGTYESRTKCNDAMTITIKQSRSSESNSLWHCVSKKLFSSAFIASFFVTCISVAASIAAFWSANWKVCLERLNWKRGVVGSYIDLRDVNHVVEAPAQYPRMKRSPSGEERILFVCTCNKNSIFLKPFLSTQVPIHTAFKPIAPVNKSFIFIF